MTLGLLLKESMSGWLALESDGAERPFAFTIRAFTTRIFSLSAPRYLNQLLFADDTLLVADKENLKGW